MPAAIGAKFACPDRTVIDIDGDGSIRMNIGELETCTTYDCGVKVLLLNNFGDGMVLQWQDLFFSKDNSGDLGKGRYSGTDKSLHKKDFILAAEADGFEFAKRVAKKSELVDVLKEFVEFDGPAFLEVQVCHSHVYPMIAPGTTYAEMITGPYIRSRAEHERTNADVGSGDAF